MTADSPASGLPQEAVDALRAGIARTHEDANDRIAPRPGVPNGPLEATIADINWLAAKALRLLDALAAERAKVAALQQAVDKVRALHTIDDDHPLSVDAFADSVLALLPDVQADDRGTCAHIEHHEWNGVRVGIVAFDRQQGIGNWEPCHATVEQPTGTDATPCPACGTTRTICDAGLNTYDTRCCEQCGHGEGK